MGNGYTNKQGQSAEILALLSTPDAGLAWGRFLEIYSPDIMRIASQFECDGWRTHDCYLFVCEKLCDNRFSRLRRFDPEGPARFRSWLKVVVANLCIDFRRQAQGRARPFRNIRELPKLEQGVFKYRFQRRMSMAACLAVLQPVFPGLTQARITEAARRVSETLTPRQQWLLATLHVRTLSIDEHTDGSPGLEPASREATPEEYSVHQDELGHLQRGLSKLRPDQRLLLKLRFQQDLPFREIARLARLGDPFRARREIHKALRALQDLLED
jgi:RNA polymerase sigma factor (sigma-70 family)